jgi:hypothetical protein
MCMHVDLQVAVSSILSKLTGKDDTSAPPLTPKDIVAALQSRGWEAEIISASSISQDMVEVDPAGILKCVDGRGSDNTRMAGPKMPGGIYAIAHNRGTTSVDGLIRLWVTGEFDSMGYPRPEFDADQGAAAVKESGGVIEMHHGSHTEKVVYINLVENKTLEPDENDQRFIVDGWAAVKFNLDVVKFLVAAAATVEMLGGPRIAKIVVA